MQSSCSLAVPGNSENVSRETVEHVIGGGGLLSAFRAAKLMQAIRALLSNEPRPDLKPRVNESVKTAGPIVP